MAEEALSISTSFNYDVPLSAQIPLIAEAGFSHVSLGEKELHSGFLSALGRVAVKGLLERFGLKLDTIHGARADVPDSAQRLADTACAATELGAEVVVFHGGPFGFDEAELPVRMDHLLKVCDALDRVAAETGVVFAIENVLPGPATDLVRNALTHLDPAHFGLCYDSAHDQIGGPRPFSLVAELKDRIIAVHLSDRLREFVDHVPPGDGFIDWPALTSALKDSTFHGPLSLEVLMTHSTEKDVRQFLRQSFLRARWLSEMLVS